MHRKLNEKIVREVWGSILTLLDAGWKPQRIDYWVAAYCGTSRREAMNIRTGWAWNRVTGLPSRRLANDGRNYKWKKVRQTKHGPFLRAEYYHPVAGTQVHVTMPIIRGEST